MPITHAHAHTYTHTLTKTDTNAHTNMRTRTHILLSQEKISKITYNSTHTKEIFCFCLNSYPYCIFTDIFC